MIHIGSGSNRVVDKSMSSDGTGRLSVEVICFSIANLIERTRIQQICESTNSDFLLARDSIELEKLLSREKAPVTLIVCDVSGLSKGGFDISKLVHIAKSHKVEIIGKYAHVETEIRQKALELGFDQVFPNSSFQSNLKNLINSRR
jgi:hypothetical protein